MKQTLDKNPDENGALARIYCQNTLVQARILVEKLRYKKKIISALNTAVTISRSNPPEIVARAMEMLARGEDVSMFIPNEAVNAQATQ